MPVDVGGLRRVILHNAFGIEEEQVFYETHLLPCRTSVSQANANMIPLGFWSFTLDATVGDDEHKLACWTFQRESTVSIAIV